MHNTIILLYYIIFHYFDVIVNTLKNQRMNKTEVYLYQKLCIQMPIVLLKVILYETKYHGFSFFIFYFSIN